MTDSCSARKLDPGLAQTYSMSSERSTSTIKSDPQWSVVRASTSGGTAVSARGSCTGGLFLRPRGPPGRSYNAPTAASFEVLTVTATAAPFRKFRRVGENFRGLAIFVPPYLVWFEIV